VLKQDAQATKGAYNINASNKGEGLKMAGKGVQARTTTRKGKGKKLKTNRKEGQGRAGQGWASKAGQKEDTSGRSEQMMLAMRSSIIGVWQS
jgi:hypothetical protein